MKPDAFLDDLPFFQLREGAPQCFPVVNSQRNCALNAVNEAPAWRLQVVIMGDDDKEVSAVGPLASRYPEAQ